MVFLGILSRLDATSLHCTDACLGKMLRIGSPRLSSQAGEPSLCLLRPVCTLVVETTQSSKLQ